MTNKKINSKSIITDLVSFKIQVTLAKNNINKLIILLYEKVEKRYNAYLNYIENKHKKIPQIEVIETVKL